MRLRSPVIVDLVDRGREGQGLPALRTVRAVLPHTALRSVVTSSGLTRHKPGFVHGEKPNLSEGGIGHYAKCLL